jgi:predicted PurR-regulated permease PerM
MLTRYQAQITRILQNLMARLLQFFAGSVSRLAWVAIVPLVTFYMLLEIDPLRARVVHLVPAVHRSRFLEMAERIGAVFSGYVRGLIIVCAGYGVVTGIVLALVFRLPYALMIGLMAAVLYAVPYVGALAIVTVAGLVAFATHPTAGFVLAVAGTLIVINQLFDQFIYPRVVGGQAGLHPLASIFALTVGGQLFGLWGMILAVPVAASVQVVLVAIWPQLAEPLPPAEVEASEETPVVPAPVIAAVIEEETRGAVPPAPLPKSVAPPKPVTAPAAASDGRLVDAAPSETASEPQPAAQKPASPRKG